jgi:predicted XRE-type DNA-binding protein
MIRRKDTGKATPEPRVTDGGANVFADLGLRNPDQELMKARLTLEIFRIIQQRGMTQSQAAAALGVKQPQVSLLMRNRGSSFSVGRLLEFLSDPGQDVEVTTDARRSL